MKQIISIIVFCLIICCKTQKKNIPASYIKQNEIINQTLEKKIDEYTKAYPITNKKRPTKYSYYVSFFKKKPDTILVIGRQPFLFHLFPDFICNCHPKDLPVFRGMFFHKNDLPITIFDDKSNLGKLFYKTNYLETKISEEYNIKNTFDTLIPPMWKYRVTNNKLILDSKTDSIIIK